MTAENTQPAYEGWAIVELMGHRQTAGWVTEIELAGAKMLRVDTPRPDGIEPVVSQIYGGAAIYCVTPCEEAVARKVLATDRYSLPPAVRLAMPKTATPALPDHHDHDDDEEEEIPY